LKIAGLKIAIIVMVAVIFFVPETRAQDIHFTQIQATPLLINPAATGISDNDFRIVNNFRNQWRTVEEPYNTYSISGDARLFTGRQAWGMGAYMIHDMSMGNRLVRDKFFLSFSVTKFYRNHQFVIGFQPGISSCRFDQSRITFNSQFSNADGTFSTSLPSYENLLSDKLAYFDCNAGFLWRARIKNYRMAAGFSVSHLNRPVESFTQDEEDAHLPLRYNIHGNVSIPLTERIDVVPMILYSQTGSSRECVAGSLGGYAFNNAEMPVKNVYALALLRINPFENMDALMLGVGAQILKFELCISYDFNISILHEATNFYGAFEISLIYRSYHSRTNENIRPCYML
jgi:type IX secretion system PorP/SprF family membrane protein